MGYHSILGQGLTWMDVSGRGEPLGRRTGFLQGTEGQLAQITLPTEGASTVIDFRYPATHSLGSITYANANHPELQQKFDVGYDQDPYGRILTRNGAPQADGSREYRRYEYNPVSELKQYEKGISSPLEHCIWREATGLYCTNQYGGTQQAQESFVYDTVGNRTSRGEVYEGNLLKAVGDYRMEYDEDGNLKGELTHPFRLDAARGRTMFRPLSLCGRQCLTKIGIIPILWSEANQEVA